MGTSQVSNAGGRGLEFAPGITTGAGCTDLGSVEVLSRDRGIGDPEGEGGIQDARCADLVVAKKSIFMKISGILGRGSRQQRSGN